MEIITLTSDMNGMTIYISPTRHETLQDIKEIATEAYDHWFACDDSDDPAWYDATGEYVERQLEEAGYISGIDYVMTFGDDWDDEEL